MIEPKHDFGPQDFCLHEFDLRDWQDETVEICSKCGKRQRQRKEH